MRVALHVLFGVLAAAALAVCGWVCVGTLSSVDKPFLGFSVVEEGLVNPVGLTSWGGESAGLKVWDRIIAIDGELVFSQQDLRARAFAAPIGTPLVLQLEGIDGSRRFVQLAARIFTPSDLVRSHASQALLGLVFVLVAVLLYFLRPGTPEAWSFFGFFATVGVCMASVVDMTLLWSLPPFYPWVGPFMGPTGIMLVGVLTRAYTKFEGARVLEGGPELGEAGFSAGRRPRAQRRMWVLTGILLFVSTLLSVELGRGLNDIHRYVVVDSLFYSWLALCMVIGLALLLGGYLRGRSPRRRARIRQILWAWPVGAGIPLANLFVGHVLALSPMSLIWNGFILLVPLSTADAIVRHDLLRLNTTARRLVGGLTVAAVMGMGLGLILWAGTQFLNLDDAGAMVALAALLFAVAAPVTHRVQGYVEGLLRSSRYDAGRLLAEFTGKASTSNHLRDVTAQLKDTLTRSLNPTALELYRFDRSGQRLLPQLKSTRPVTVGLAVQAILERSETTVIDDEQPAPPELFGASLMVRLAVANEPVGLLVVGPRSDGVVYEGGDVSFVASLAGPLAAALVNTLGYEAIESLNRELEDRVLHRTQELAHKNDELALLNQRKDELVATVSHDFRSPLAIIRQNVQTMLRDLSRMDKGDLRSFLEGVARQEDRLTALCTNLLDLARLRQRGVQGEPVDMAALAAALLDGFQTRAKERGVTVALHVDDNAPVVVDGDRDRLGQVLQNLIDNALKFTAPGGKIDVGLRSEPSGLLHLVVEDNGCGVPADALPRLFEPFFQVPRQSHVGQGSGLGLAIVKAVVDAHGGSLSVQSTEGTGTAFTIALPGRRREALEPPAQRPVVRPVERPAAE